MSFKSKSCLIAASLLALVALGPIHSAEAAKAAPPSPAGKAASGSGTPMLPGASSKEPININAAKLDYFDKEQKLIYTGDVVAVQGDSTLKASVLTIFLTKDPQPAGAAPAAAAAVPGAGPGAGSSVSHMEADGPVTLISKDQVGTGDHASYDKAENKVYMKGHVTLSQGTNVTQGDRLVYDMTNGQAQVFSDQTTRVSSVFTPGTGAAAPGAQPAAAPAKPGKPAAAKRKPKKAAEDAAAQ